MTRLLYIYRATVTALTIAIVGTLVTPPAAMAQYNPNKMHSNIFLPVPPTDSSASKMVDNYLYFYYKKFRTTAYRPIVSFDQYYVLDSLYKSNAIPFGIRISNSDSPNILSFVSKAMTAIDYGDYVSKSFFQRIRPAVRFYEATFAIETLNYLNYNLSRRLSYPSAHTLRGTGLSLVLASIAHNRQDTILHRGYDFGQSRIIGGAHWHSDVEAARLIASVNFARMFASGTALTDLETAKNEYISITQNDTAPSVEQITHSDEGMKRALSYIPEPLLGDNPITAWDQRQYTWGRTQRDTQLAQQAIEDSELTPENIGFQFSQAFKTDINELYTPKLYYLIQQITKLALQGCDHLATTQYNRTRPCILFNDPPGVPEDNEYLATTSSYPCRHAAVGWAVGMLLNAVNSENVDSVMLRAYQYGSERVIAGTNWESDTEVGRRVGIAAFVRLASASDFSQAIAEAQSEDQELRERIIVEVNQIADDENQTSPMFTIDGLPADNHSRGVLVGRNKKIFRP